MMQKMVHSEHGAPKEHYYIIKRKAVTLKEHEYNFYLYF